MKKRKLLSLLAVAALAVGTVGCKNSGANIGPPLLRLGVASGASYSLLKYPEAKPAVKASADIICAQANGTNFAPASVVEAVNAYREQTPESVLIVNAAINLYTLVWNGYGAGAVTNSPELKLYLTATCDGLNDALAGLPMAGVVRGAPQNAVWPQVKFK